MIKNNASDKGKHIDDLRGAFEHRAAWFYLLIEEAQKRGLDMDFARDAIYGCGCFHGKTKFTQYGDDLEKFCEAFAHQNVRDIFEMDVKCNSEEMNVTFHYCPLVNSWQNFTKDEEKIAKLCDIAMDGDRGIANEVPFEFKLGKTIAKGDDVCEVTFRKRKNA